MGRSNSEPATPFWIRLVEDDEDGVDAAKRGELSKPLADGQPEAVIDLTRFNFDRIVLGRGENNEKVPSGRRKLRPRTKA